MQDDPAFARQALRAGALGYVLKETADEELLAAIRLAAAGDTYLNPVLAARLAARPSLSSADSKSPMPAPIIGVPHALHTLAHDESASMIVVGSTARGHSGRVLPGSTAERLLPPSRTCSPHGRTQSCA